MKVNSVGIGEYELLKMMLIKFVKGFVSFVFFVGEEMKLVGLLGLVG